MGAVKDLKEFLKDLPLNKFHIFLMLFFPVFFLFKLMYKDEFNLFVVRVSKLGSKVQEIVPLQGLFKLFEIMIILLFLYSVLLGFIQYYIWRNQTRAQGNLNIDRYVMKHKVDEWALIIPVWHTIVISYSYLLDYSIDLNPVSLFIGIFCTIIMITRGFIFMFCNTEEVSF
ncbi:hypothetical protein SAMN04487895_1087 [Paenibacillus sophorae]|uniref:Uncharacterized protein n=1 Tax=Paenibacillus sophorae TaxID=1333845 RepID=A0A1H8Q020_9BACL|nr:hypothetical protein [Paenibacillus sophorae]QWU15329.1 hypothetical protein KP014_26175 [Paenibacillus sophorae]SEO47331.1 hypothetical protein SAMN04487895_1087 [Paenibacillus sophorae]